MIRISKILIVLLVGVIVMTACEKNSNNADDSVILVSTPSMGDTSKSPYYESDIGLWYCVWWDSAGQEWYEHHWKEECRSLPCKFGEYATDDSEKLEYDFSLFTEMGIDFLIMDDTNNHMADNGNIAAHIDACFEKAKEMGNNAPMICIAGGSPLLNNNLYGMRGEMNVFYKYYKNYTDKYYCVDGKPLFVNFNIPANYSFKDDRFTIGNSSGHTSEMGTYLAENQIADEDKDAYSGNLYGWVFNTVYEGATVYGVNPGWSRTHNGMYDGGKVPLSRKNGDTYREMWLRAIKGNAERIIIASWNDHCEETGIEAVEILEDIEGREEEYKNPYIYEQLTRAYIALQYGFVDGFYYKEESSSFTYIYGDGKLTKVNSIPDEGVLVVIPDGYFEWAKK